MSEVSKDLEDLKPSLSTNLLLLPSPLPKPMPLIPLLLPLTPKYLPGRPAPSTPSKSSTPSFPHDPTTKKPPSSIPVANATRPPPTPELPGGGDLEGYPEHCRPGNGDGVVLYTTTLRGVRRAVEAYTVEVEAGRVAPLEVYLKEVMELSGEGAAVPRLFKRGRYVGGVEEVVELGETGKLREMLWVAVRGERGEGKRRVEGVRRVRWGKGRAVLGVQRSCKVVEDGEEVARCGKCNENGLVLCPLCH